MTDVLHPRRRPLHPAIDEGLITAVVISFYRRVRADEVLGPIFDAAIEDRWDEHLDRMCDFWSSVMTLSGRYKGKPVVAHLRLKTLRREHFCRWLELFSETTEKICEPGAAALFQDRARRIAANLQGALFCTEGRTA